MAFPGNVTVVNVSDAEHPQAQTVYGCFHGLHRSEQWIRLQLRPIRKPDLSSYVAKFEWVDLTMHRTVHGLTSEELAQYMARDDAGKHATFSSTGTLIMADEQDTHYEFECEEGREVCEYGPIIELDRIEYPAYIVKTILWSSSFVDEQDTQTASEIDEIQFMLQHGTSSETTYLALFKLLSLGVSYLAWMKYKDQLRRLRAASRSEEQLLLQHLLFCLMLFNDPFYVFEVLLGGSLLPIVSVMFEVTYWATLLLFWAVAVDRTRLEAEDKRFERRDFYENKLKLCGVFWFSTVFVFCGNLEEARSDPVSGTMLPTFLDKFFTFVAVGAVGVYAVWIGGIVWALHDQRELQALSRRFQYLLLVSGGLAAVACFGTIMCGYFNMLTTNMGEYTGLYSLFNIYTVLVAFLYSPAPANAHISLPERSEQPHSDAAPSPDRARQLEKAAAVGAGGVVAMGHDDDDDIFGASPPRAERGVSTGVPTRASPGHASASQAPVSFDQIDNSFAVGDLDDDDDDGGLDGDTEIEL